MTRTPPGPAGGVGRRRVGRGTSGFGRPEEPTRMADHDQPAVHAVRVPLARTWPGLALLTVQTYSAAQTTPAAFEIDRAKLEFVQTLRARAAPVSTACDSPQRPTGQGG